ELWWKDQFGYEPFDWNRLGRMHIQQKLARDFSCNIECREDHYKSHMKKYFFHLDGLIRSKVSFHQALYLILELGETTARCTQDILRHRDSLDRFSKVSWVICHRGRGPLLMPMILRHFYHVTYHWQLDRWMMVKEIVSRLLDEEGRSWNGGLSKTLIKKKRNLREMKMVVKYES
nr:hypothetical protein [Tanacetum cinerariifolium]